MLSVHLNVMLAILLLDDQMPLVVHRHKTRIWLVGLHYHHVNQENAHRNQLYCMERLQAVLVPDTWTSVTFDVMMVMLMMEMLTISPVPKTMTGQGGQYVENNRNA